MTEPEADVPAVPTFSPGRVAAVAATALGLLVLLDLSWLGLVARELYAAQLGDLLAPRTVVVAAALFYVVYVGGLLHFAILPGLRARSGRVAALQGALLGLVAYATWDLTNLAVIAGFPAALVPVDIAWGASLSAAVSASTTAIWLPRKEVRGA